MKFNRGMHIGVFTRNHREYLEAAAARNTSDPVQPTTFRSRLRWTSARRANEILGPLRIYFAPIGGENQIEFEADLTLVHLDPKLGEPKTDRILADQLESTTNEGLWEEGESEVQTLYQISRCEQLDRPYPFSELTKASDAKPISPSYGYSYVLVNQREIGAPTDFQPHPEEVGEPERYTEGATHRVSVNVYERSSAARRACVAHHGTVCSACGFDFEEVFGELGKGFIHVHHLKPLAEIDAQYKVDPVQDLRPICPNCHAMIHKTNPAMPLEELQGRMRL